MRIESSVTSISWIPSEAVTGMTKMPFEMGMAHYDQAPPDVIEDLEALRLADRFRFANELRAWIEVEDGRIVSHGYSGKGHIGSTTIGFGRGKMTVAAVSLPDRQQEAEVDGDAGAVRPDRGRPHRGAGAPAGQVPALCPGGGAAGLDHPGPHHPRRRDGPSTRPSAPAPSRATGSTTARASWSEKTGVIDFKSWYTKAFGGHSPWGDEDSPALVTAVETALERELSQHIMRGDAEPTIRKVGQGTTLVDEGDSGSELFLLLDGVLAVEVKGEKLVDLGPGVVLGERALLEGGHRTATLRAETTCKVAVVGGDQISPEMLAELAGGHRREEG